MEKGGVFLFLLIAPNYCLPLVKDNALDVENDAMFNDEAAAKEAGSFQCVGIMFCTQHYTNTRLTEN
jgi:hypothetical protein